MAIDSEKKRRGTAGAGIPGIAPIVPDGSVDGDGRAFLSGSYPFDGGPGPSMIKCVKFFTRTKLSGADCKNAPFILCVSPGLVATPTCEVTDEAQDFTWSTINASLKEAATCEWVCDAVKGIRYQVWKYQFLYNTSSLTSGVTALGTKDILGAFHKGCMAKWVEELVGNEPYIETEDGSSVFVSPHGCRYPIISGSSCYTESQFNTGSANIFEDIDGYLYTEELSLSFLNPFSDSELVITGGHTARLNISSAASVQGLVNAEVSINGGGYVTVGSAARSTTAAIKDLISVAGFLDGESGTIIPPSGSGSITARWRLYLPDPSDQAFSYLVNLHATAHRNTL